MKKFYFLLLLLIANLAFSQVTFRPGIRGGINISHVTQNSNNYYNYYDYNGYYDDYYYNDNDDKTKSRFDFYIGFLGNIRFTRFYALQPEVNYSRQGSKFEFTANNQRMTNDVTLSYVGIQLVNKFYLKKFNLLVGPTLDFLVEKKNTIVSNEVDLGITAGVGYDITKNFGVEARVRKGFIPVYDYDFSQTNVVFQAGVYYTFDMK